MRTALRQYPRSHPACLMLPAFKHTCAVTVLLCVASACGGSTERSASASAPKAASGCASAEIQPIAVAVREYITKASPQPQRYLSAAGTDSALPEDGFKVLQDKGPTFYYSGSDTAAQRKIRTKLMNDGPYASLLVLFKGQTESDGGKGATIKLAGQYVAGAQDGQRSPLTTYSLTCDSTSWKIVSSTADSTK